MKSNKRYLRKNDATFDGGTTFDGDLRRRRGNGDRKLRWWLNLGGDWISMVLVDRMWFKRPNGIQEKWKLQFNVLL